MTTTDYNRTEIGNDELNDIKAIANISLADLSSDRYPDLLVFPESLNHYDSGFGSKIIGYVTGNNELLTNSVVGFVGRNNTQLSIHSRFAKDTKSDYFLHYMLHRINCLNLFDLQHSISEEDAALNFLIYLFPRYLNKAIGQGLLRRYINNHHNDCKVKGSIDISRHIHQNIPFTGNIAYHTRDYSADNPIMQLIRHTIEYISTQSNGHHLLNADEITCQSVDSVIAATMTYNRNDRCKIIKLNRRPVIHPFYSEYITLQKICLQILLHEELKYGSANNTIHGLLIDAAWLWEEYLSVILGHRYVHYLKDSGSRFHLFKPRRQQIIPDFLSCDKTIVADAKYIPLDKEESYHENSEKATAIFYKTITYMYRFASRKAFLFYPQSDKHINYVPYVIDGNIGGEIVKLGMRIPSSCVSFSEFSKLMKESEEDFLTYVQ